MVSVPSTIIHCSAVSASVSEGDHASFTEFVPVILPVSVSSVLFSLFSSFCSVTESPLTSGIGFVSVFSEHPAPMSMRANILTGNIRRCVIDF